jgi:TonB-dependent starch-binding outer membrane protein SusC
MGLRAPSHTTMLCWTGLAVLFLAAPLRAQPQTGTITGSILDKSGRQPLNGVQVSLDGTRRGTITDGRGRFVLTNVPVGEVTVRATNIGYRTELKQVTVPAGGTVTADFELGVSAISLDEVVVTGTAGAVEKKELGANVATVSMQTVRERIPVTDFGQVLQSRVAGVRSIAVVGGVGASKDLRIRGTSSFTLGQRPIVYVDGVKIDNNQREWGGMGTSCCSYSGGAAVDRLHDINPNDIDRIEVIKGAAAGTLYGSEAANGVIQIFTKKGRSESAPRWTAQFTTGFQRQRPNFQTTMWPQFQGPDGTRALDANKSLIESAPYMGVDMAVQGGGQMMTYFVSGAYTDEQGSVQPNWMKRGNLRLNVHWLAGQKLSFDVTSAYTRNRIFELQSGNNWTSLLGNAVLGVPYQACEAGSPGTTCQDGHARPWGEPWVPISAIKLMEGYDDVNRWTGGATANYSVRPNFTNKFQIGVDAVNEERFRLQPFGFPYTYVPAGEKDIGYRNFRTVTAEYLGSLRFTELLSNLSSTLSFGVQGFQTFDRRNMAVGAEFAAPGQTTVNGGKIRTGREEVTERKNVGVFGQNRFGYNDRVFLTTGFRYDGHSAFGDDYGFQFYPNVQLTYDLSQERFIPSMISNLRLRGSVGTAGQAPGAFDKFLTFAPFVTGDDESGVRADEAGNVELGPERTTEKEIGLDAGFLNDRIGLEITLYRRDTKDAITRVALPPSTQFANSNPFRNIGGIRDQGYEVALRFTPIESAKLRWTADLRLDGNHNEITDLGIEGDTAVKRRGNLRLGLPVLIGFARNVTGYNPTTRTFTRTDTTVYQGRVLPGFNGSLGTELSFGAFRLYGLVTMEQGAMLNNSDRPYRVNFRTGDEYLSLLAPAGSSSCVTTWPSGAQGPRFDDTAKQWCQTAASDSLYNLSRAGVGWWNKRDRL